MVVSMAKIETAPQAFTFQRSPVSGRITVLNNLSYAMGEYDGTTGITRWTRVVPAAQRENVQAWLIKNYPVQPEEVKPVVQKRKRAA
jgi:hypothetical protein